MNAGRSAYASAPRFLFCGNFQVAAKSIIASRRAKAISEMMETIRGVCVRVGVPFSEPNTHARHDPDFNETLRLETVALMLETVAPMIERPAGKKSKNNDAPKHPAATMPDQKPAAQSTGV